MVYQQQHPFLYVHLDKKKYVVSVCIGLMISVIIWMIVTLNLTMPDHIEHYPLSEQNIMLWIKKKCKQSNCMHRLGIFPGSVMVEVMPKVQMPNECASIRKGVGLCLNEQLSPVF